MTDVTLYSKDGCVKCKNTARQLKKYGRDFTGHNISVDEDAKTYLLRESERLNVNTMPFVYVDGVFGWSDFRIDKIKGLVSA